MKLIFSILEDFGGKIVPQEIGCEDVDDNDDFATEADKMINVLYECYDCHTTLHFGVKAKENEDKVLVT